MEFLDFNYIFAAIILETDMFYKYTDAHRYLNYRSYHPKFAFNSVVYSQFLQSLCSKNCCRSETFKMHTIRNVRGSDYPNVLLDDMKFKILGKDRDINYSSEREYNISG